jgi:DNA-binding transcriptional LysR family regulator
MISYMVKTMTFGQLRTFVVVARRGSVTAAAAELFVTPPAISAAVSALERELGLALLEREGRGIRLTGAGQAFAHYAAASLGLLEQGRDAATFAERPGTGRLRVAAVMTAGEYVVPAILKGFRRTHPDVDVQLEVGNSALVIDRLLERRADVGIGGRPPAEGSVEGRPFLDNRLIVVGAPDHPLANRRAIDPRRIDDVWLVREPGSGTAAATQEFLSEHGVQPRAILHLGSNGAAKQAAAVGLGVTLISAQAVSLELAAGTLAVIGTRATPIARRWFALSLTGELLPGAARAFLEFVQTRTARAEVGRASRAPVTSAGPAR